jgi:hypothetical protein
VLRRSIAAAALLLAVATVPAQAGIRFVEVVHTSQTLPMSRLAEERIVLKNTGPRAQALTGWTIRDKAGNVFRFDRYSLCAGCKMRVRTGNGTNGLFNRYWGRSARVWDQRDTATLRNASGGTVDVCRYPILLPNTAPAIDRADC